MSELARQRIRENIEMHRRGEDATVLDLGNCGMTELPEEIEECVWVETLFLSDNEGLSDLSPLANLPQLQTLYCPHQAPSNCSITATVPAKAAMTRW